LQLVGPTFATIAPDCGDFQSIYHNSAFIRRQIWNGQGGVQGNAAPSNGAATRECRIMTVFKWVGCGVIGLALSACAGIETSNRNQPFDLPGLAPGAGVQPLFAVSHVHVVVPPRLTVSDRDGLYPTSDIVWRGEPSGDRPAQITALFETAATQVQPTLLNGTPAIATITLERFHGVTERVQALGGGVYAIRFLLTLTDPVTGADLVPPEHVQADLVAPRHVVDERALLVDHLTRVLAAELSGGDAV